MLKNRLPLLVAKVRGRGDRRHRTHRLDSVRLAFRVDQRHHHVGRLASTAGANNADACHRISVGIVKLRMTTVSDAQHQRVHDGLGSSSLGGDRLAFRQLDNTFSRFWCR